MDTETLKLMVEIVQGLIVLFAIVVHVKRGEYDDAAAVIQAMFTNVVSHVQYTGLNAMDMKKTGVKMVKTGLEDPRVYRAVKKLGIEFDDQVIGDVIERVLSSGKLGVQNPVADLLKAQGTGPVLGTLLKKRNKVRV